MRLSNAHVPSKICYTTGFSVGSTVQTLCSLCVALHCKLLEARQATSTHPPPLQLCCSDSLLAEVTCGSAGSFVAHNSSSSTPLSKPPLRICLHPGPTPCESLPLSRPHHTGPTMCYVAWLSLSWACRSEATKQAKRAPTLLQKLLVKDIRKDHSHLLQCFRCVPCPLQE